MFRRSLFSSLIGAGTTHGSSGANLVARCYISSTSTASPTNTPEDQSDGTNTVVTTSSKRQQSPQERQSFDQLAEFLAANPKTQLFNPFMRKMESCTSPYCSAMIEAGFRIHPNSLMFDFPSPTCVIDYSKVLPPQKKGSGVGSLAGADGGENIKTARKQTGNAWKRQLSDILVAAGVLGSEGGTEQHIPSSSSSSTSSSSVAAKNLVLANHMERTFTMVRNGTLDGTGGGFSSMNFAPDPESEKIVVNGDQKAVLEIALRGHNVYIGGSAGTGKTAVLRRLHFDLHKQGLRVAMTATTGVAAVHINGYTFHHVFGVPKDGESRWDHRALRAYDVAVVDEVSMLTADMLDRFDAQAKKARLSNEPFGGLQVILCGDFMQLSVGNESDVGGSKVAKKLPMFASELFHEKFVHTQLTINRRQNKNDPLYPLLRRLRVGQFDSTLQNLEESQLDAIVDEGVHLYPKRRHAQEMNSRRLRELPGDTFSLSPQCGPLRVLGEYTPTAHIHFFVPSNILPPGAKKGGGGGGKGAAVAAFFTDDTPSSSSGRREGRGQQQQEKGISGLFKQGPDMVALAEEIERLLMGFGQPILPTSLVFMPLREQPTSCPQEGEAMDFMLRCKIPFGAFIPPNMWTKVVETALSTIKVAQLVRWYPEHETIEMVPLDVVNRIADRVQQNLVMSEPLHLKLGCRVMILRNMSRQVTNGTVGHVVGLEAPDPSRFPSLASRRASFHRSSSTQGGNINELFPQLPVVQLANGSTVMIPPTESNIGGSHVDFGYGHSAYQVPVQAGYAYTVHKVQGLTLDCPVTLDLTDWFDCEHLVYVACSRVRSISQLAVHGAHEDMLRVDRAALSFASNLPDASTLINGDGDEGRKEEWQDGNDDIDGQSGKEEAGGKMKSGTTNSQLMSLLAGKPVGEWVEKLQAKREQQEEVLSMLEGFDKVSNAVSSGASDAASRDEHVDPLTSSGPVSGAKAALKPPAPESITPEEEDLAASREESNDDFTFEE